MTDNIPPEYKGFINPEWPAAKRQHAVDLLREADAAPPLSESQRGQLLLAFGPDRLDRRGRSAAPKNSHL